jgi:hypothetical protein
MEIKYHIDMVYIIKQIWIQEVSMYKQKIPCLVHVRLAKGRFATKESSQKWHNTPQFIYH